MTDPSIETPQTRYEDLPCCPDCQHLLRSGVMWLGEQLPLHELDKIDRWLEAVEMTSLMCLSSVQLLVSRLYPSTSTKLKRKGAIVVELNISEDEELLEADFFCCGDVARTLPDAVGRVCTGQY